MYTNQKKEKEDHGIFPVHTHLGVFIEKSPSAKSRLSLDERRVVGVFVWEELAVMLGKWGVGIIYVYIYLCSVYFCECVYRGLKKGSNGEERKVDKRRRGRGKGEEGVASISSIPRPLGRLMFARS